MKLTTANERLDELDTIDSPTVECSTDPDYRFMEGVNYGIQVRQYLEEQAALEAAREKAAAQERRHVLIAGAISLLVLLYLRGLVG